VVFLSGEPSSEDEHFFLGKKPTIYSSTEAKQRIALSRGARGSIMIPIPNTGIRTDWKYWVREFAFEHVTLAYSVSGHMSVMINPTIADKILAGSEYNLDKLIEMHTKGVVRSFDLHTNISFAGDFDERDFLARNVVGVINGSDDQFIDSYLLLSAHYDHLGIGPEVNGDNIYNGAMDNALGVASLLEITRVLAALETKPRRSIVIIFLTGEEKGLLGSTYYTDNPLVPLHRTLSNINIDGIAAFDEFKDIISIGAEFSSLQDDVLQIADSAGLAVSSIPSEYFYEMESVNRSDQLAFMKAGIPSVLIVEGLNYRNTDYSKGIERLLKWNQNVYHTPFDDLKQNINFNATVQHTQILFNLALHLAEKEETPQWKPGSPFINARLQTIAETR
jgi:hypothetical protein